MAGVGPHGDPTVIVYTLKTQFAQESSRFGLFAFVHGTGPVVISFIAGWPPLIFNVAIHLLGGPPTFS